jgi:hypothetical protein
MRLLLQAMGRRKCKVVAVPGEPGDSKIFLGQRELRDNKRVNLAQTLS